MKNKIETIKLDTQDEGTQDNSAYILIVEDNKKQKIAFSVDEIGK